MMRGLEPGDPQLIGPYRLRERLGAGGMGRVYLGLSPGGRPTAVKVIRADLATDPEFRARFRREIAIARQVSGLFTAPVIDADVDGPVPWLATAYVEGPSLADAVSAHGPLPPGSVLALAAGLAEGLNAIHAAGVVHRDLKPANVLLAADGPRVIDFGISRATEASALTHTGLVVGSPGFMSPEQAEGHSVGPPSDIFSLGAVLAFAATGHGPFGTGSTPALVYRVVHSTPNLDHLPAQIRPLVQRCLAKNPAQRPTAAQLLAGAAYPAAGWLPEPVTRTFSLDAVGPAVSASLPVTGAWRPARVPVGVPAPPLATPLASPRAGQASRRAGRNPWRSRWRPLTAAAILAGLIGAGVTAGVAMTASSPPARAAQSVRQDSGSAPVQAYPPASDPASPATTAPTSSSATTPAYVPAPSTPPPAAMTSPAMTMTSPPATSAPPRPSTSPSPSTSSPYSTSPAPTPSTSAPTTPAGY
jgi:serine/threonine protein kinase